MTGSMSTARLLRALAASAAVAVGSAAHAGSQPNVLFIMADDMGAEALNSYGGTSYTTPNLSQLAATGRQYNHAYSTPLCTPTRVQLLTGQYNFRNYESFGWLDPDETTFAQTLRAAGYTTAVAGKWQLSDPDQNIDTTGDVTAPNVGPAHMRDGYGFDQYSLWQLNTRGSRYWDPVIEQNGAFVPTDDSDYGPDIHVDFLTGFMQQAVADDRPFLAYYSMELPHDPWVRTPDSTSGSKTGSSASNFGDNVAYVDTLVGRLVQRLETLGVRDETLIVFTSDNGTHRNIVSQTEDGPVGGDKGNMTDAGTHVPLILNWQGTITGGEQTDRLVDFTDFFPTLMQVAGLDPSTLPLDGKALTDANGGAGEDRDAAYLWYDAKGRNFPTGEWARDQQYKLYDDGRLFDTQATPLERAQDVIAPGTGSADAEAARANLQQVLDHYAVEQGQTPPPPPPPPADEDVLLRYSFTGDTAAPTAEADGIDGGLIGTVGTNTPVFNNFNGGTSGTPSLAATGWTTGDDVDPNTGYFSLTFDIDDGFTADLDALRFLANRNASGPTDWVVRWSLDGFADDLDGGAILDTGNAGTPMSEYVVDLDARGVAGVIELRLYGIGGDGALRIDDVRLLGSIIPEPTSAALLTVGLFALARRPRVREGSDAGVRRVVSGSPGSFAP